MRRSWLDPSDDVLAILLLTPAFLLLALIVVFPVGKLIWTSLLNLSLQTGQPPRFVGLQNYLAMLDDPVFWLALKNTALITLVTVPGALVCGMALALLANMPFRRKWPVKLALLMPWVMPNAFTGLIF